jgi:hypothetical protein
VAVVPLLSLQVLQTGLVGSKTELAQVQAVLKLELVQAQIVVLIPWMVQAVSIQQGTVVRPGLMVWAL